MLVAPSRVALAAVLALATSTGAAVAADLAPQLNVPSASWQGPYVGVNLGYQFGSVANNPTDLSGFAGGLQGGYNLQRGQFVFGVEADIQASAAEDRFAPWKFSNPWFGTLRGRAGAAFGNVLLYGTVGVAYGALRGQNTFLGTSQSSTEVGWTAGAGVEMALTRNWSSKIEYLYIDLGERPYWITGANNGLETSLVRFGVNYRF